jgi:sulfide:quinone oxidoreductase
MLSELPHVIVAGGGPAGVEAVLTLREHLGSTVALELVTPETELVVHAYEVLTPFHEASEHRHALREIGRDLDLTLTQDALAAVKPAERTIRLRSGAHRSYDALVVALGGHRVDAVDGAISFRGVDDAAKLKALLHDAGTGLRRRGAFVLPGGHGWPLPLYELALQTSTWLAERRLRGLPLTIVSPEHQPLEIFGPTASLAVAGLLQAGGIDFVSGFPIGLANGSLLLSGGRELPAEVAIALPRMHGPAIIGLPRDAEGFLPVDADGRVEQVEWIWAAGDVVGYPIKQGGLATQQADTVATSVAAALGAAVAPEPFTGILRAVLVGGARPLYLQAELTDGAPATSSASLEPLWPPQGKLVGRRLGPYLFGADAPARAVHAAAVSVDSTDASG